ncbi:MAG: cytochrome P450 [Acidimicrobiales bacterium]
MTDAPTPALPISDAAFWQRPMAERMADLAAMSAVGPFTPAEIPDLLTGDIVPFTAVTGYPEIVEISRNPRVFCSSQGSTSIPDMPAEAQEFFGSFIAMDDPRHARQRGIVARSFTPRRLAGLLESVEEICAEVIDGMCEAGEVDLVEAVSAPFPLLVICDMMGVPRSEFQTVKDATDIILGAGDPELVGEGDLVNALLGAGLTLTGLMQELAEHRRSHPMDDLTSALVHNDVGEDMLAPEELGPFFILLAVAGNDTTRTATSLGMHYLGLHPDQRRIWQDDLDGVTTSAVEEIVRYGSPVTFMRRTVTERVTVSGREFQPGEKLVLFYGAANRDTRVFDDPDRFDVRRDPNPHLGFGGPGPHFCLGAHLARRELGVIFRQLFTRLPDIEVAGDPVFLQGLGPPLVSGVKRLPVRFTPTAPRPPR